jgi:hypothetical protein
LAKTRLEECAECYRIYYLQLNEVFQFSCPFSLFATIGFSQVVAIQNDMERNLRLCFNNHLTVAVEGLGSADIVLSTDNGSIEQDKDSGAGHYVYRAKVAGVASIYVQKSTGNHLDTIERKIFVVRSLPVLPPLFAGKSKGSLSHAVIAVQMGIMAPGEGDSWFPIFSYSIAVCRKGKEVFRRKVAGPRIDDATRKFFYSLKNGDQLKFENIFVEDCDGNLRETATLEIVVKDSADLKGSNTDTLIAEDPVTGQVTQIRRDSILKRIRKYK